MLEDTENYYARVSAKGKATDKATRVRAEVEALKPWCASFEVAGKAYLEQAEAQARTAKAAAAAADQMCRRVHTEAATALSSHLDVLLDTWRGARTMVEVKDMRAFRESLLKLAPICARPENKTVVATCDDRQAIVGSESNQRYTIADLCRAAGDPSKTLAEVALRVVEYLNRGSEAPSIDSLRKQEGWVHELAPVTYPGYFTVNDKTKEGLRAQVAAAFEAAGVPMPTDLSQLWAKRQAHLDALKLAVDATRGEWKQRHAGCTGYTCALAKTTIKRQHPKAQIKKVLAGRWEITKNALGIPKERALSMLVMFALPGEPGCQLRQLTAYEEYKGGGKYQRAGGTSSGYVRFELGPCTTLTT